MKRRRPKRPKPRPKKRVHRALKRMLGFKASESDAVVLRDSRRAASVYCKPCWELRYCPYGPLVEDFPVLPLPRHEAIAHHEYLNGLLHTGTFADGKPLDAKRRAIFREEVRRFRPADYPEEIPDEIAAMECSIFGHICPVVFTAEEFT